MRRHVRVERRLPASPEAVRAVLAEIHAWERWMPFLHSVETVQEADGIHRLRVATPLHRQGRPFLAEVMAGRSTLRLRELEREDGLEGRWSWTGTREGDGDGDEVCRVTLELGVDTPWLHFRTRVHLQRAAAAWMEHLEEELAASAAVAEIYRVPAGGGLRLRYRGGVYRLVPEDGR